MRKGIAALVCLLTAGCVSTNVRRLDDTVRPARSPESVALLTEAPAGPYVVIAVIEAKNGSVFDTFDGLRKEMVSRAAALGGDAVILDPEVSEDHFILTGTAMIRSEERRVRGRVIVFGGATGP